MVHTHYINAAILLYTLIAFLSCKLGVYKNPKQTKCTNFLYSFVYIFGFSHQTLQFYKPKYKDLIRRMKKDEDCKILLL